MPHLAPLNWALASIIFWVILLTLAAILWWQQTPNLPSPSKELKSVSARASWNWS